MDSSLNRDTSDTSFWALQELLKMPTRTCARLTRLRLMKGVILINDLVEFARKQAMVQEILLSDTIVVKHDGEAMLVQSFCFHQASSIELHNRVLQREEDVLLPAPA